MRWLGYAEARNRGPRGEEADRDVLPLLAQVAEEGPRAHWTHLYHNATTLHPVAVGLLVVMGVLTLFMPRRHAWLPTVVVACFVSPAQRILIFGADFTLLRLMILFLWARILLHNEAKGLVWKPLDTAFVVFKLVGGAIFVARTGEAVNRAGLLFDAFGLYFAA